jgi:hypothetical protein
MKSDCSRQKLHLLFQRANRARDAFSREWLGSGHPSRAHTAQTFVVTRDPDRFWLGTLTPLAHPSRCMILVSCLVSRMASILNRPTTQCDFVCRTLWKELLELGTFSRFCGAVAAPSVNSQFATAHAEGPR